MTQSSRALKGTSRLYGDEELALFQAAQVVVVGLGGVGSWAVEALARSGIGHVRLIDMDILVESNINRQLPALHSTLGRDKVKVLAERCMDIQPDMTVQLHDCYLDEQNIDSLLTPHPHLVLDCSDDFAAKKSLVLWCRRRRIPLVVAGATGGKRDPSQWRVEDLARTERDPLLAKLRRELRRHHKFPLRPGEKFNIATVYSQEPVQRPQQCEQQDLSCSGMGSSMMVTCTAAMLAVAEGLRLMTWRMRLAADRTKSNLT